MAVCPIRLQERCEIYIARVSANDSRPEHGPESVIRCDGSHPGPWLVYHEARATSSRVWHGRNVFTVLLTGFGKSLCYACPPTVFGLVLPVEGTSIVLAVAPLTSYERSGKCCKLSCVLAATSEAQCCTIITFHSA